MQPRVASLPNRSQTPGEFRFRGHSTGREVRAAISISEETWHGESVHCMKKERRNDEGIE
jgi:hypothetical protein